MRVFSIGSSDSLFPEATVPAGSQRVRGADGEFFLSLGAKVKLPRDRRWASKSSGDGLIKCLLHRHEGPSSIPRACVKSWAWRQA